MTKVKGFMEVLLLSIVWTAILIFIYTKSPIWCVGLIAWTQAVEYYSKESDTPK